MILSRLVFMGRGAVSIYFVHRRRIRGLLVVGRGLGRSSYLFHAGRSWAWVRGGGESSEVRFSFRFVLSRFVGREKVPGQTYSSEVPGARVRSPGQTYSSAAAARFVGTDSADNYRGSNPRTPTTFGRGLGRRSLECVGRGSHLGRRSESTAGFPRPTKRLNRFVLSRFVGRGKPNLQLLLLHMRSPGQMYPPAAAARCVGTDSAVDMKSTHDLMAISFYGTRSCHLLRTQEENSGPWSSAEVLGAPPIYFVLHAGRSRAWVRGVLG